jgi:hypothetical protein
MRLEAGISTFTWAAVPTLISMPFCTALSWAVVTLFAALVELVT